MITRENYEEFFLSYVDNELSAEARLAVEHFAAANPDLQEELESLLQCRLEPEQDTVFPDKRGLLQHEESLLLYVDGELDAAKRLAVEKLVSQDVGLRLELERIKMTVSEPDPAIVFPDKESLYHSKRRVVMLPWLRVAVAAAVPGVAALLFLLSPRGHKREVVVTHVITDDTFRTAATKKTAPAVTINDSAAFHSMKAIEETAAHKTGGAGTNGTGTDGAVADGAGKDVGAGKDANGVRTGGATGVAAAPGAFATSAAGSEKKKLSASPRETPAPVIAATGPIADSGVAQTAVNVQTHPDKPAVTAIAAVNIPKEQRSFATQALLQEAQQDGNGDMADNAPPTTGKTKLRGLFRRVTRAFGKTADRDDDGQRQVSISVFQVALK